MLCFSVCRECRIANLLVHEGNLCRGCSCLVWCIDYLLLNEGEAIQIRAGAESQMVDTVECQVAFVLERYNCRIVRMPAAKQHKHVMKAKGHATAGTATS